MFKLIQSLVIQVLFFFCKCLFNLVDVYVSTTEPVPNRFDVPLRGLIAGGDLVRVCPENIEQNSYTGTYFIGVYGYQTTHITIRVDVEEQVGNYFQNQ